MKKFEEFAKDGFIVLNDAINSHTIFIGQDWVDKTSVMDEEIIFPKNIEVGNKKSLLDGKIIYSFYAIYSISSTDLETDLVIVMENDRIAVAIIGLYDIDLLKIWEDEDMLIVHGYEMILIYSLDTNEYFKEYIE